MSHYALLVEVRDVASMADELQSRLETAMEPFYSDCDGGYKVVNRGTDEEDHIELPQDQWHCGHKGHKWDWWQIGGRYRDRFQVIAEPSETPIVGRPGVPESMAIRDGEIEYKVLGVDAARKRDIDWEGMAAARRERALEHWVEYNKRLTEKPGDIGILRYIYGVEDGEDRDTFARRRMNTFSAYALLLADGTWVESETFIYEPEGKSRFEKNELFDRIMTDAIASMPDDAVLAFVDYHN